MDMNTSSGASSASAGQITEMMTALASGEKITWNTETHTIKTSSALKTAFSSDHAILKGKQAQIECVQYCKDELGKLGQKIDQAQREYASSKELEGEELLDEISTLHKTFQGLRTENQAFKIRDVALEAQESLGAQAEKIAKKMKKGDKEPPQATAIKAFVEATKKFGSSVETLSMNYDKLTKLHTLITEATLAPQDTDKQVEKKLTLLQKKIKEHLDYLASPKQAGLAKKFFGFKHFERALLDKLEQGLAARGKPLSEHGESLLAGIKSDLGMKEDIKKSTPQAVQKENVKNASVVAKEEEKSFSWELDIVDAWMENATIKSTDTEEAVEEKLKNLSTTLTKNHPLLNEELKTAIMQTLGASLAARDNVHSGTQWKKMLNEWKPLLLDIASKLNCAPEALGLMAY